jgi:hypothetical protein
METKKKKKKEKKRKIHQNGGGLFLAEKSKIEKEEDVIIRPYINGGR